MGDKWEGKNWSWPGIKNGNWGVAGAQGWAWHKVRKSCSTRPTGPQQQQWGGEGNKWGNRIRGHSPSVGSPQWELGEQQWGNQLQWEGGECSWESGMGFSTNVTGKACPLGATRQWGWPNKSTRGWGPKAGGGVGSQGQGQPPSKLTRLAGAFLQMGTNNCNGNNTKQVNKSQPNCKPNWAHVQYNNLCMPHRNNQLGFSLAFSRAWAGLFQNKIVCLGLGLHTSRASAWAGEPG